MSGAFDGAKVAILVKDRVLTILRDDRPDVAWAGLWDFPGGAREGDESPWDTVARELEEELGLILSEERIVNEQAGPNDAGQHVYFFLALWDSLDPAQVRFGNEGQEWRLMPVIEFLDRDDVIPAHQRRLRLALAKL